MSDGSRNGRKRLSSRLLVALATIVALAGTSSAAYAEDNPTQADIDYGVANTPPAPTTTSPPDVPTGDCTAGGHWTTTDNRRNYLSADYRTSATNDRSYSITATFTSNATSTYTWSTGASFSASAKAWIFAEVKGEVNTSISKTRTSTYGESVTVKVPAHDTVHGDHGKVIEYLYGYSFYLYESCTTSAKTYSTVRAPYRINWHVY